MHPRSRLLLFLVVASCGTQSIAPPNAGPTPAPIADSWVACRTDDECVAIEMGCCDHCNGGWALAVNKPHAALATRTYHAECTATTRQDADGSTAFCGPSCTELGCGAIGQRCSSGRCTWTLDATSNHELVDQPNVVPAGSRPEPACRLLSP